jgi:hypothetical protein
MLAERQLRPCWIYKGFDCAEAGHLNSTSQKDWGKSYKKKKEEEQTGGST